VHVDYVDYAKMNTIDRDAMWAELFRMYHAGYEWEILGKDIETLGERNDKFIDYSLEYDLINEYFEAAKGPGIGVSELTAGKIKEQLDKYSNQKTNLNKVGQELKRLGYRQHIKKVEGKTSRVYYVHEKKNPAAGIQAAPPPAFPDLEPF
jgi:predicted P-loop ATPase